MLLAEMKGCGFMEIVGKLVLYIIMACCALGAIAAAFKPDSELGKSFHEGISMMASLFVPIIGLMISVPYLRGSSSSVTASNSPS